MEISCCCTSLMSPNIMSFHSNSNNSSYRSQEEDKYHPVTSIWGPSLRPCACDRRRPPPGRAWCDGSSTECHTCLGTTSLGCWLPRCIRLLWPASPGGWCAGWWEVRLLPRETDGHTDTTLWWGMEQWTQTWNMVMGNSSLHVIDTRTMIWQ